MRHRRALAAWGLALAALAAGLWLGRHWLLTELGKFLDAGDVPERADAIVVLSGSIPDRILEAVDLYQAGLAPRLVLTREGRPPGFEALRAKGVALPERHEENRRIAVELGVPADVIEVLERRATSTLGEARELISYLRARRYRTVLLVTSRTHGRRARSIFRSLARGQPRILVIASRYDPFEPGTWWHYRALARRVVTEYGKLLVWYAFDRWRDLEP